MPRHLNQRSSGLPVQPHYIRTLNALGRGLGATGLQLPRLDAAALMGRAERRTGAADFGDDSFLPALNRLVDELNGRDELSQLGRIVAYFNLLDHLSVRLRLIDYRRRRPQVAEQRILRPLFILGLPRTGTTILFELIAQDPDFRSPASWEVSRPFPPPQRASYDSDPRIRSVDRLLVLMEKFSPGFRVIHPLGARLPQECVYLMASQFLSEQFGYMYNLPDYRSWLLEQDMSAAYRWHAQFLQHLQVDCGAARWVLKTPAHLGHLNCLFQQYPDAAVVWTHRRPLQAIASFSSLTSTLRSGFSDDVDPVATGRFELEHHARVVQAGLAQRLVLDESAFLDVDFDAICENPLAVVERIYAHFGFDLSDRARDAMAAYLRRHPRNQYGVHRYHWQDFGLSEALEGELYSEYLQRFAGDGVG